jgi:putative membrane fusion protein
LDSIEGKEKPLKNYKRNVQRRVCMENGKVIRFPSPKKKRIGRVIFIAVIIGIVVLTAFKAYHGSYKICMAEYGYIKPAVEGNGIIIRKEKVIKAPISGNVNFLVAENTRVRTGDVIAEITDPTCDLNKINQRIEEIDLEIKKLESEHNAKGLAGLKISEIEEKIQKRLEDIKTSIENGDLSSSIIYKREIESLLNREKDVRREFLEPLERLEKEKRVLLDKKEEACVSLKAPFSGIVSYKIDGFEEVYNTENLEELSEVDIKGLNSGIINIKTNQKKVGEPVFKIIDNFKWYLIAEVDPSYEDLLGAEKQGSVWIEFSEGDSVRSKIYKKLDNGRLIFEVIDHFDNLAFQRKAKFKIVKNMEFGIVIPVSAVVVENGEQGVIIKGPEGKQFKKIDILYSNAEQAVVEGLKRWEQVLITKK